MGRAVRILGVGGALVVEQVIGLVSDVGLIIWASKYRFPDGLDRPCTRCWAYYLGLYVSFRFRGGHPLTLSPTSDP